MADVRDLFTRKLPVHKYTIGERRLFARLAEIDRRYPSRSDEEEIKQRVMKKGALVEKFADRHGLSLPFLNRDGFSILSSKDEKDIYVYHKILVGRGIDGRPADIEYDLERLYYNVPSSWEADSRKAVSNRGLFNLSLGEPEETEASRQRLLEALGEVDAHFPSRRNISFNTNRGWHKWDIVRDYDVEHGTDYRMGGVPGTPLSVKDLADLVIYTEYPNYHPSVKDKVFQKLGVSEEMRAKWEADSLKLFEGYKKELADEFEEIDKKYPSRTNFEDNFQRVLEKGWAMKAFDKRFDKNYGFAYGNPYDHKIPGILQRDAFDVAVYSLLESEDGHGYPMEECARDNFRRIFRDCPAEWEESSRKAVQVDATRKRPLPNVSMESDIEPDKELE